ncbi:MAG TPA: M13 family metallopeptidase [Novosphingobium sp.]|nr:M13 family metallopeptidase [Novosphingobium sp.]
MTIARFAFAAALSFAALSPAIAQDAEKAADRTTDWGAFGVQTRWIDPKADPGDDFDRYVNGLWNDTTKMPEDKTRIGAFIDLRDLSEERLKGILDGLADTSHPAGSPEARVAAAYKAFMDKAAIDAAGLVPVRPSLERIFAIQSLDDLARVFAAPGFASPIGAGVDADEKQSDRYALYIGQSGLGLPDRDYYLVDSAENRNIRAKYLDFLSVVLGEAGYADPKAAARAVYSVELRMAQEMWDRAASRDRDLTYNKLDRAEAEALGPAGLFRTFLDGVGARQADYVLVAQMPPTPEELNTAGIAPADAAAKFGGGVPATLRLIQEVPLSTWKAYLAAHFLSDHASFLPEKIDRARFDFYGTVLGGQPQQRPRWKRAISAVEGQLGELLGRIYAGKYYPPAEKAQMEALVANLRKAMAENLHLLKWMGPETRKEALAKLDAFNPKIGAPDKYKDYAGLDVTPTTALANQLAAEKWQADFAIGRLGKEVDRSEWFMLPQTVNAYYNPVFNEIVFPAAILQPPFFNLSADPAVNYGAIGGVIGHEMGHGFDDQGAKSDGAGNLRNWWSDADKRNFKALQDKLVKQYNGFCPFDQGKTCIDGELTLGENIGDLGGLSLAYRAYKLSLGGKPAPVIGGFTGDQRFFMAWAQVWRGMTREETARQFLITDPHSPPEYRINGIVRNFDEWYKAFDVTPDDKLYLPPAQRVRIW